MNWSYWYGAMNLVTLFWIMFFVLTIFHDVEFRLVYVGLVAIVFIRVILACMFFAMNEEDEINHQAASVPNVVMEPAIELV